MEPNKEGIDLGLKFFVDHRLDSTGLQQERDRSPIYAFYSCIIISNQGYNSNFISGPALFSLVSRGPSLGYAAPTSGDVKACTIDRISSQSN
ncbi:hypothetical protein RRG08_055121 [Elysia crispata]|uniref:Uncharacterized protein n=1 Tax=Elysia crispata TaxID=231223 RepID=A0AAE1ALN2_9GAST|nr:hypothetical protein RRG08_055121 [Elysia crispata]